MVLLGVGNVNMGDDSAGMIVADMVAENGVGRDNAQGNGWTVFKCGLDPEHYTRDIRKLNPRTVVLVDAVDMALPPGEIRRIGRISQDTLFLTTHRIPLSAFMQYLQTFVPECHFIGIQPEYLGLSPSMSPRVAEAVTSLSSILSSQELERIQIME